MSAQPDPGTDPETVKEIVHSLPEERAAEIGAILGRQVSGFKAMSWGGHLDQVIEEINDATAAGTLTPEAIALVRKSVDALLGALDFAERMMEGAS